MLKNLEKLIDDHDASGGDGEELECELRQAAQHLWRSQFLYESEWGTKTSYEVIRRYAAYFEDLFDALGYRVVGRPSDGFVGLLAKDLPPRQTMKLDESLLLLILRLYYEEALKRYEINESGEVEVESETILQVYEDRTHRERPPVGRLRDILAGLKHRGLVRMGEQEDSRNFTLFIRPALPVVISEEALASLEEFVAKAAQSRGAEPPGSGAT